ncbi:leucine-rich repeat serine/threonine-protein kinase 1 [Biomphalaria glabrata]|nr:serine/threonine-protein kinase pats1 [Biomphalaria glabrata]
MKRRDKTHLACVSHTEYLTDFLIYLEASYAILPNSIKMPPKGKKGGPEKQHEDDYMKSGDVKKAISKTPVPPSDPPPPVTSKGKGRVIKKHINEIHTEKAINVPKKKNVLQDNVTQKRPVQQLKSQKKNFMQKTFEAAQKTTEALATEYAEDQESEEESKPDLEELEESERNSVVEEQERELEASDSEDEQEKYMHEEVMEREQEASDSEDEQEKYMHEEVMQREQEASDTEEEFKGKSSLMKEIKNFPKSKLKKFGKRYDPVDDIEVENESINKSLEPKTLNQKLLCYDFWNSDCYPVHKLKYIVLQIPARAWVTLNFSGLSQLTDMTFAILNNLKTSEEVRFNSVRGIILDGCFLLTNSGLEWMADTFPNLSLLSLVGCNKVTTAGLLALSKKCPNLSSMDFSGTSINYLPKRWIKGEGIKMTGCSVIFPVTPSDVTSRKEDTFKDDSKNLYKICIIRREKVQASLLSAMNGESQKSLPDFVQYRPEIADGELAASVIEIHETLSSLMITDQSLVVITSQLEDKTKLQEEVSSISSHILDILGKNALVHFLLVGFSHKANVSVSQIKEEVEKYLHKVGGVIKDNNFSLLNAETNLAVNIQLEYAAARRLHENISKLTLNCTEINLEKTDGQQMIKNLCQHAKHLYTSEDLTYSKDIYDWAKNFHSNCPQELQSGIHSLSKAADLIGTSSGFTDRLRPFGAVHFLTSLGKICMFTNLHGDTMVCNTRWLCDCLNLLLSPSSLTVANNGLDHTISDDALVWPMEILENETKKKNLSWDQIEQVLIEFPYPWFKTPSSLTSLFSLSENPTMSTKIFTDFQKKTDEGGIHLVYSFVLNQIITPALSQEIIMRTVKLHIPVHVWKTGVVVYDSIVALMIGYTGMSKVLNLCAYMMSSDEKDSSIQLIYNTAEKYKTVVEYVLRSAGFSWELLRNVSESIATPPENICGVIHGHVLKASEPDTCKQCGINPVQASLLTAMELSIKPSFLSQNLVKSADLKGKMEGSAIEFTGPSNIKIAAVIDPFGCHQCCVLLMQGIVKLLKISIISSNLDQICVDLGQMKILVKIKENEEVIDISNFLDNTLLQGETITFKLKQHIPFVIEVYLGPKLLSSIPMPYHRYELRVSSSAFQEDINTAMVTVKENNFKSSTSAIQIGMRLEAVDHKNPHLICVASITDINQENGQVLIHFDGWSDGYDYWADVDSEYLHPVGFMACRGDDLSQKIHLRPELQPPSRYQKEFKWLTYLKEVDAEPVPYECFTEQQIDSTPPDLIHQIQSEIGFNSFFMSKNSVNQACPYNPMTSQSIENQSKLHASKLEEKIQAGEMDQILETQKDFFCFLPVSLSLQSLRFPELSNVFSNKEQKLHFLCPGQNLDVHLVNHPGLQLATEQYGHLKNWSNSLKMSIGLMLLQKCILPSDTSSIIVETKILPMNKRSQLEVAFKRLLRLYLMHCLFFRVTEDLSAEQLSSIQKILETAEKSDEKGFSQIFSKAHTQGSLLCNAHKLANSPSSGIFSFPLHTFQNVGSNISIIHLENNPLETLPEEFFSIFPNLTQLWLDGCKLSELPSFKENKSLEELHIKGNCLLSLPDNTSHCTSLKILDVSNNPLEILPQVVSALVSLTELYADNIGTVDLEIISPLKHLRKLSLAYNYIDFIPDAFSLLPLTYLDMSGLPFIEKRMSLAAPLLNSFLDKYTVYRRLTAKERTEMIEKIENTSEKLSNAAKVTEMNKILFQKYPRLGKMSEQQDLSIPDSILKITTLETLILPFHAFVSVPDSISNMTSLETLIVESNPNLESVSPEIAKLPIKKLHLRECIHLKTPPKEVVRRGFSAVFGYLKRLLQGYVSCKRTKLMTVGLGGAGKTSLVRALTNIQHTFNFDYAERITDGIDITEWLVDVSNIAIENEVENTQPLHFSVWDFAGQTVYYNTHQFFLSNRAVYLLLWNIRLGFEHAGLDFWLSSIACHAPKAPILVVGTHCDKVKKGKLPIEELRRRFPQIVGFHFVSSYSGEGISELQDNIIKSALAQTYMGEKIPEAWLTLERQIDKLRENKALLKFHEVEDVGNTVGILDNVELVQAVQFLHDLGSVQFFNTPFLKSHVVIVSQWIVDVMACIVTVHEGPIKEGKFYYTDMPTVWAKYPEELHPWLLRLTEEFDLTFPLSNEEANIVPCLLPNAEPQYDFTPVNKDNNERETKMIYNFDYLPAGLFNRVQVRLHQFSDSSVMWKTGFMLKKNNHRALLRQTSNTQVLVIARGCRPENTLFLVHEVFECLITDSYSGVSYDFSIPCAECLEEIDPCMFPASKIKRAFELKVPFLQCDKNFHIISIPEIMSTLPPDPNADFDDHLGRSIRELQELDETVAVRVFFIYSKRNIPDLAMADKVTSPTRILEDMRAAGYNVSYCDDVEKSNMESLTLAIKSAQVVVVGISDEFIESAKCRDLIIYIKQTLHKTMILAAIGTTLAWQKTDINLILADEVFIKMTQVERYDSKIQELVEAVKSRRHKKKQVTYPECFISYCWANSKMAVDLGSATKEGALGWGDPRKIKEFLQSKGVSCWLDIEQMGQEGFFEDIADGLRKAKVMVACVSDEYAASKNCKMEFRFAVSTLKIPSILAVVGTGYSWERSEIGLLTVGHSQYCPKINLQYDNPTGLLELYAEVQKYLPQSSTTTTTDSDRSHSPHNAIAFQEVLELTQRKLLRQISLYSSTMDMEIYPRIIVIDLKNKDEETKSDVTQNIPSPESPADHTCSPPEVEPKKESGVELQETNASIEDESRKSKYCFKVLCEHEMGWHEMSTEIKFPEKEGLDLEEYLKSVAPYMARILAVLKYSTVNLPIVTTPQGEHMRKKFEEWSTRSTSEFQSEYSIILQSVIEEDEQKTYGGLKRCHMPNGKILWLCSKHEKSSFTLTEEKYKHHLTGDNDRATKFDDEMEDEESESRPNSVMKTETVPKQENTQVTKGETKSQLEVTPNEEKEEEQKAVKVVSPVGGHVLPRRPKLVKRSTGSKKTTSQACSLM